MPACTEVLYLKCLSRISSPTDFSVRLACYPNSLSSSLSFIAMIPYRISICKYYKCARPLFILVQTRLLMIHFILAIILTTILLVHFFSRSKLCDHGRISCNKDNKSNDSNYSMNTASINVNKSIPADGIDAASGAWWVHPSVPEYGHAIDIALCRALEELFQGKDILDLGAGIGWYGRCFLRIREPMFPNNLNTDAQFYQSIRMAKAMNWWLNTEQRVKSWTGFDGSPNIEHATNGFVKHMDLTKPQTFNRTYDFVLSMEVGEHIPAIYEATYIANILKPVKEGLVISWAVRGQDGRGHVNELNNTEVVEKMAERGFAVDDESWWFLRSQANYFWFKWSLLVFYPTAAEDGK